MAQIGHDGHVGSNGSKNSAETYDFGAKVLLIDIRNNIVHKSYRIVISRDTVYNYRRVPNSRTCRGNRMIYKADAYRQKSETEEAPRIRVKKKVTFGLSNLRLSLSIYKLTS